LDFQSVPSFSSNLFMVFCIWIMNSDFWCMLVSYFWAMVVSQSKSDSCLAWASTYTKAKILP